MSNDDHYRFVCPECGASISVSDAMRDAVTARGCAVCGSSVSAAAFDPR